MYYLSWVIKETEPANLIVHIVSNQIYPEGYSYDHIEIQSEKRPYGLTVYLNSNNGNLTDEEKDILESASEEVFKLIGNVQTINYSNAETSEMIAAFNRDDVKGEE